MLETLSPGASYGKILKSLEMADFIMSEINHPAKSRISSHSHENAHFCFVIDGAYTEFHRKNELVCKPLTLTFRHSGEIHADEFHERDVRVFIIEISPQWNDRLLETGLKLNNNAQFKGGLLPQLVSRLNREFHLPDSAAPIIIEGLALEIIAETARYSAKEAGSTTPRWLKQAHELLHSRFFESLSLRQIAAEVKVHPVHLATTFRQKYGYTVGEYIRQLRIEYACREIAKGKESLAQIALNAGFSDQSQFTKTFKRQTGMTPASYKNSFQP